MLLERDAQLVAALRTTQQRLQATQVHIDVADALAWMARSAPASFDLVFLDPPFGAGLVEPALAAAVRLVVQDGFIYLESSAAVQR